ncbi:site-specific integrase [Roseovarius sp. SYSU LYC5161]|uniref:site-specific integrase n=1 Tax=Roseovarius halophilus (ex Wu et al. 2025) TaxID=3376060 RepID=UPI00399AC400
MTYTTLTRAHLRQYLESVVQAEVARIEDARLHEAPPASSREWRARWMRDRAEAYALRLLSSRGPGAELLPEDMDHLRDAGFQPRDMAMFAEALYTFSTTYYRDKTHSAPEPADVVDHAPTAALDEMLYTREALKGAAVAREQLDRRKAELEDPIGTVGSGADTHVGRAEANESASAAASRYSPEIREIVDRMDDHDRRAAEKEGKDQKTTEAALRQRRRVLEQFTEAVGKTRITALKTEDLAHYIACLARLPVSYNKSPADRALTLQQHMERGDDLPGDAVGLSGNTVNRNLTFLSTLLNHAKKEGLHPSEPLDVGLYRTKQKKLARDQRPSFTPEDVSRIFQHPTWHGRQSAARPHTAGDEIVKDALYWVPLVAAYSGLRLEEICGLRLEDVVLRCEHPYLDIRPNANRGLKNTQSRRLVPLHQDLIDLGFPDYCTRLRAAGDVDVFPDLKPGTPTNAFGDTLHHSWHELLKRQIGPDTGGKVFHSFRHYVISQLKRSGVGIDIIQDLVGHLHGNVTEDRYADRTDLALLAEAVNQLPRVL